MKFFIILLLALVLVVSGCTAEPPTEPKHTPDCANGEQQACSAGLGLCKPGIRTCVDDSWGICIGTSTPTTEICGNGLDEDCDGTADNGCVPLEPEPEPPANETAVLCGDAVCSSIEPTFAVGQEKPIQFGSGTYVVKVISASSANQITLKIGADTQYITVGLTKKIGSVPVTLVSIDYHGTNQTMNSAVLRFAETAQTCNLDCPQLFTIACDGSCGSPVAELKTGGLASVTANSTTYLVTVTEISENDTHVDVNGVGEVVALNAATIINGLTVRASAIDYSATNPAQSEVTLSFLEAPFCPDDCPS
ncbi:MAG: hypothetical protein KKA90_03335 [Nanoarchaeota archaeon]|nr:hypothetical protein [Nanoarchaeota archaeon]